MTAQHGDCCPACGSADLQPFAVIVGAAETYGYQCLDCATLWPVLQTGTLPPSLARAAGLTGRGR